MHPIRRVTTTDLIPALSMLTTVLAYRSNSVRGLPARTQSESVR